MLLLPPMRTLQAINFSEFFVIGLVHHNKKQLSCGFPNHYIELKGCDEERGYYWTWGENTLRTFANKRLPLKFFIAYLVPRTKQQEEDWDKKEHQGHGALSEIVGMRRLERPIPTSRT